VDGSAAQKAEQNRTAALAVAGHFLVGDLSHAARSAEVIVDLQVLRVAC
jgi:hypothetical protein